jgi:hypothetical protein
MAHKNDQNRNAAQAIQLRKVFFHQHLSLGNICPADITC